MSVSKKDLSSYSRRLRDNIKSVLDNYSEILKASKVSSDEMVTQAQVAHTENEVAVRAANIVRAAEALSKLVSDLKENLILNDFSTINEITSQRSEELGKLSAEKRKELAGLYASVGAGEDSMDCTEPQTSTDPLTTSSQSS